MKNIYSDRKIYRDISGREPFFSFQVSIDETDLQIQTSSPALKFKAEKKVRSVRKIIKDYIKHQPSFMTSLEPVKYDDKAHPVIQKMIYASKLADVGPMASVAGCLSQEVGEYLLKFSDEVIIENGGDIFIKTNKTFVAGLYAGKASPFSNRLGIKLKSDKSLGICTSSGTLGHSLSFGAADAMTVICEDAYIADAFATSLGNKVKDESYIDEVLELTQNFKEILGAVIIVGDKIGAAGEIEFVPLK